MFRRLYRVVGYDMNDILVAEFIRNKNGAFYCRECCGYDELLYQVDQDTGYHRKWISNDTPYFYGPSERGEKLFAVFKKYRNTFG